MELFDLVKNKKPTEPLAARMRPTTIDEIVGQKHILGKDKLLYRAIKADKISSLILYGPPGTGKTTIAKVIANMTQSEFKELNATIAGKKDMEAIIEEAKKQLGMYGKKTILFIDEIHRFNKGQQDYLLSYLEKGLIILIGATTENPYFEVNRAILSRSQVFELKELSSQDIKDLIIRVIGDKEKGLGDYIIHIDDDALSFLAETSSGDARVALNALELGALTTEPDDEGKVTLTLSILEECIQKSALKYDKDGDTHYDTVSAFIKSMRGSDPDAAIYYLAKMLTAGEDVKFIARRIMICASEDVGNADPQALVVATNAALAVERIGMPEAQIILAQAVTYIASAPKSNAAYLAIKEAMSFIQSEKDVPIPNHLKDAHYKASKNLGRGENYLYPHNYKNNYVEQQYLPDQLKNVTFYTPSENGYEKQIKEYCSSIKI
jgi:putative ATPase